MRRSIVAGLALVAMASVMPSAASAQAPKLAKNAIYLELGGSGVIYSINYERILQKLAVRAGFSYLSVGGTATGGTGTTSAKVSATGIPVTMTYLLGGGSSKFEMGGGILFEKFSGQASWGPGQDVQAGAFVPMGTFVAGYRYSPPGGGFNFKLSFTPVYHPDVGFWPWGGMSFGVGF